MREACGGDPEQLIQTLLEIASGQQRTQVGQAWDLGHIDGDRLRYAGPEHRHSRDCGEGGTEQRLATLSCAMQLETGRRQSRKW